MFEEHDPYLVALSVLVAILGGYTGFALAARIRNSVYTGRRLLLSGAAGFLAVGIWTMHFIGMMAAPLPQDAAYLVLPTLVSFLICALVVGISLYFVSIGGPSRMRVLWAALLLGFGIASMHYAGIHGLAGPFTIRHDYPMVALSLLIAIGAAYGGLRIYIARHGGLRLALSAVAFGIAVSGMHYTAMYGMHFEPGLAGGHAMAMDGLVASQQVLSLVVALLCFLVAGGFLLLLVPEAHLKAEAERPDRPFPPSGRTGRLRWPASASRPGRWSPRCPSTGRTASGSSRRPISAASAPMRITRSSITGSASACAPGRSRRWNRSSVPRRSCASIAAISSPCRTSC
jgi:NO-binding membrane sensor protein with MHYT domain